MLILDQAIILKEENTAEMNISPCHLAWCIIIVNSLYNEYNGVIYNDGLREKLISIIIKLRMSYFPSLERLGGNNSS